VTIHIDTAGDARQASPAGPGPGLIGLETTDCSGLGPDRTPGRPGRLFGVSAGAAATSADRRLRVGAGVNSPLLLVMTLGERSVKLRLDDSMMWPSAAVTLRCKSGVNQA
jgi:hypothetical protein